MSRYSPISPEVIDAIKALGFDVYTPQGSIRTYLYFTEGDRIGYLQKGDFGGYSLSTVHIPNRTTGTGFGLGEVAEPFTVEALREAFATAPSWASSGDIASVRKWASPEVFFTGMYSMCDKA